MSEDEKLRLECLRLAVQLLSSPVPIVSMPRTSDAPAIAAGLVAFVRGCSTFEELIRQEVAAELSQARQGEPTTSPAAAAPA